jgi:hypothetical protein
MNRHGDVCASTKTVGASMITCQGGASVLTFASAKATPTRIMAVAHSMIRLASDLGKTQAAVVGANWLVTGPEFDQTSAHSGRRC